MRRKMQEEDGLGSPGCPLAEPAPTVKAQLDTVGSQRPKQDGGSPFSVSAPDWIPPEALAGNPAQERAT